jgi:hypothetical protein
VVTVLRALSEHFLQLTAVAADSLLVEQFRLQDLFPLAVVAAHQLRQVLDLVVEHSLTKLKMLPLLQP